MGTNFYWIAPESPAIKLANGQEKELFIDYDDPDIHIGKRSAAGMYCWDCDITLCKDGNDGIHYSKPMYEACPKCNAGPAHEKLAGSSSGIELGLAQPETNPKTGVRSCCSFSWCQEPAKVRMLCADLADSPVIVDEYGIKHSGAKFLEMIDANCPVQFTRSIGERFS